MRSIKQEPKFTDIELGFASAEVEGARAPNLLLQGYYDNSGIIDEAIYGHRYLFLGYKGAGKTAIGERLRLMADSDPKLFVTNNFLSDFPYNSFKKIAAGDIEPESRYPTAWAWILLLRLIDSFRKDEGAYSARDAQFQQAVKSLETLGLLSVPDIKQLVMASSKQAFKAQIPHLLEATVEKQFQAQDVALVQLVSFLRSICQNFTSSSQHLLIIDGLDDILTQRDVQYQSLAALVLEVSRLNNEFTQWQVPAKIVLLCRTDLFESLPGANKNKIRRDSATILDWYQDSRAPEQSALVELINYRGRVSGVSGEIFDTYFPREVTKTHIPKALLDVTRHTPRDMIQLLSSIQLIAKSRNHLDMKLSRDIVLSGMRRYSIDYLLPEIKDELVGTGSPEEIEAIFSLISGMRSRDFRYVNICMAARRSGNPKLEELDIDRMLHGLYECSAIGTVHEQGGYDAYTFKFRNRNSSFGSGNRLMLHKGIWKAMNVA